VDSLTAVVSAIKHRFRLPANFFKAHLQKRIRRMPRVHIKEKKRKRGTTAAAAPKDFTVRDRAGSSGADLIFPSSSLLLTIASCLPLTRAMVHPIPIAEKESQAGQEGEALGEPDGH
jgi:hypothetical protein